MNPIVVRWTFETAKSDNPTQVGTRPTPSRSKGYRAHADEFFPDIDYMVGDLFEMDRERSWDLVISSHTIEHIEDPSALILELQRRARHWVLVYAPFEEKNIDSSGHLRSITREFIESFDPMSIQVIASRAWRKLDEPDCRAVLFILKGTATKERRTDGDDKLAALRKQLLAKADDRLLRENIEVLWKQARYFDAAVFLEPLVLNGPISPQANYCLGYSYHRSGQNYQQALSCYEKALELGFDEFWVRYSRADLYSRMGEAEMARIELEHASELSPNHPGLKALLHTARQQKIEKLHEKVGERDQTINILEEQIERVTRESERTLEELHEKAAAANQAIQNLEATVGELNQTINVLEEQFERVTRESEGKITALYNELQHIKESKTWRLLSMYLKIRQKLP